VKTLARSNRRSPSQFLRRFVGALQVFHVNQPHLGIASQAFTGAAAGRGAGLPRGCTFRLGGGKNRRNKLDWIWFCAFVRRQGHLTYAWPRLLDRMGKFDLEPQISEAMQTFVASMCSAENGVSG
jgi:hypothetical protein